MNEWGRKIKNNEGKAETEYDRDCNGERQSETRTVIDKHSHRQTQS